MVRIIDLTYEIFNGMPVYPGDPPVILETSHTIKNHGYKVTRINFGTHTSTHIDAQAHMIENGKALSDYPIEKFVGIAHYFEEKDEITNGEILIFKNKKFDSKTMQKIKEIKPKMIGFTTENDLEVESIKKLLEKDILVIGPLKINESLPKKFLFCALPLNIRKGDGSPVRAIAILD